MRDIKRIKPLLSKIEILWRECPNLRFAQIVEMIKHEVEQEDIFNVEDDLIEDAVDRLMDKRRGSGVYVKSTYKEFIQEANKNKISKEFLKECERASKLIKKNY